MKEEALSFSENCHKILVVLENPEKGTISLITKLTSDLITQALRSYDYYRVDFYFRFLKQNSYYLVNTWYVCMC